VAQQRVARPVAFGIFKVNRVDLCAAWSMSRFRLPRRCEADADIAPDRVTSRSGWLVRATASNSSAM
jgi:hypothetical protein